MKCARAVLLCEMALASATSALAGGRTASAHVVMSRDVRVDSLFWWHVLRASYVGPDSEPTNNDRGEFAWPIADRLDATSRYLVIVSGDSAAWRLLRRDVAAASSARDSRLGVRDYAGRAGPVWSTIDPYAEPKGTRSALLVDNAQVAAGLAAAALCLRVGGAGDRWLADSALVAARSAL